MQTKKKRQSGYLLVRYLTVSVRSEAQMSQRYHKTFPVECSKQTVSTSFERNWATRTGGQVAILGTSCPTVAISPLWKWGGMAVAR